MLNMHKEQWPESQDFINSASRERARVNDYVRIMRLDHATKHVFIVPGMVAAFLLVGEQGQGKSFFVSLCLGLVCALCIASANYVINEFLDQEFDRHHPTKSVRAAVQKDMSGKIVFLEWAVLCAVGMGCAYLQSWLLFVTAIIFALQGIVYNVSPMRSKDKAFLDVASESINNPLRLLIGWAIVAPHSLPPVTFMGAYWCGGAFLMAAKRLSEYREIGGNHGHDLLSRYRASFAGYTENSLVSSCLAYAFASVVLVGLFLVSWRVEYVITLPFVVALFVCYYLLAALPESSAQNPERLFREKELMVICVGLVLSFVIASVVPIPFLRVLIEQRFIPLF